jgi:4-hydroxybenzoyl-CoA thioesterase
MSKVTIFKTKILFGDCDPAGIVFFPNFSKWMDASSLEFFMQCGVPPWREYEKTTNIIGTPLLEINTKFKRSATYGEEIEVHTSVIEWREKVFIHKHQIFRKDGDQHTLLCEGTEVRAFCQRQPDGSIKAVLIPEDIKSKCLA